MVEKRIGSYLTRVASVLLITYSDDMYYYVCQDDGQTIFSMELTLSKGNTPRWNDNTSRLCNPACIDISGQLIISAMRRLPLV